MSHSSHRIQAGCQYVNPLLPCGRRTLCFSILRPLMRLLVGQVATIACAREPNITTEPKVIPSEPEDWDLGRAPRFRVAGAFEGLANCAHGGRFGDGDGVADELALGGLNGRPAVTFCGLLPSVPPRGNVTALCPPPHPRRSAGMILALVAAARSTSAAACVNRPLRIAFGRGSARRPTSS